MAILKQTYSQADFAASSLALRISSMCHQAWWFNSSDIPASKCIQHDSNQFKPMLWLAEHISHFFFFWKKERLEWKCFVCAYAHVCMYEKERKTVSCYARIFNGVNALLMHITYPPFKLQILKSEIWVGLSWKKNRWDCWCDCQRLGQKAMKNNSIFTLNWES